MAAGLKNSCGDLNVCNSKWKQTNCGRSMAEKFQQQNQSLICRELKGVDTGKVLRSCPDCIADAIRIVGEEFGIS
ncbi:MAG: C-GCAxxG-C-C family protein [Eubacterium sp.]